MKKDIRLLKLLYKLDLVTEQEVLDLETKPLIDINDLSVNFRRRGKLFEAVKNANLKINDGEILGLVGESGSGKTTLGRATISLWDHASGSIKIDGRELPKKRIKTVSKKNIWVYKKGQMIFQDPTSSLNRQQKVLDIVNEGQKNFETIKNEYKELLEIEKKLLVEKKELLNSLETKEQYVEYIFKKQRKDFLKNEILKTTNSKFEKLLLDFDKANEIEAELNLIDDKLSSLRVNARKNIKIIKQKRSSDKSILIEESAADKKFIKSQLQHEIADFKILQEKFEIDEITLRKTLIKRFNSWYKNILIKTKDIPANLVKEIPTTWDEEKIKILINKFEKILEKKSKLSPEEKFTIKSLVIDFKIALKKREKEVSPYNTKAFDFIYNLVQTKILNRIKFYNKLMVGLNKRHEIELEKFKKVDKNEEILVHHGEQSINYLEEYKEILVALIKEFAVILLRLQEEFLDHESKGIKNFYNEMLKQSSVNDKLQAAIITWKAGHAIKYEKRLINKNKIELNILKDSLSNELENRRKWNLYWKERKKTQKYTFESKSDGDITLQ